MQSSTRRPVIEPGLVEIRSTFASRAAAAACAERLVTSGLAACVHIDGPLTSIYSWQGAVETAEEWRCTCKTTLARRDDCVAGILAVHDYETPQVTIVTLEATAAYAAWVRASVGEP
ncbi:MAG: divalent-cation tolerance protein CutA [Planctomycetia bacterium]